MQPRISIIVPCYNGAKYLRETLDCLQKQTIEDWECIIVNDGSTDNSLEILKEYAETDLRYKFIDKKNEGPSIARNIGIAASSGKYILPLDADDLIAPSYAEKAIDYLSSHPKTKMVYCICQTFCGNQKGDFVLIPYSYDVMIWRNMLFNAGVFRKSDFEKTSGYNPNMRKGNEDWDFWISFLNPNDDVYQIPEKLFFYRKEGSSRHDGARKCVLELNSQMILNHLDVYKPFLGELFDLHDENEYLRSEMDKILNSLTYKLGTFFSFPIRKIKAVLGI